MLGGFGGLRGLKQAELRLMTIRDQADRQQAEVMFM
jgi:hypothetical protein